MIKVLKFLSANILEILLITGTVFILLGCYFGFTLAETKPAQISTAVSATVLFNVLVFILFLPRKDVPVKFDIIYLVAYVILIIEETLLGVLYLDNTSGIPFVVGAYSIFILLFAKVVFNLNMYIQTHLIYHKNKPIKILKAYEK